MQLNSFGAIVSITIREGIRNRALQGILCIAGLLCVVYLTVIPLFAFDTGKVAVDLGFASTTLAGLAIIIFLGIALVAKDIHQRSVCMILARPIPRHAYILGKFTGVAVTVLIAFLLIALMGLLTTWLGIHYILEIHLPRNFSWGVLILTMCYQYIGLLILVAVAFFFTVLTSNEYLSMLFNFCVYLIGNSLETIVKVLKSGEYFQAGPVYEFAMKLLTWFFPNLKAFDLKVYLGYGLALPWSALIWTGLYGLCYTAVLIALTVMLFNRKELR